MRASTLAAYLGVGRETVRRWIAEGRLQAWKCPVERHYADARPRKAPAGVWRVWEKDVRAFLAARRGSQVIPDSAWRR